MKSCQRSIEHSKNYLKYSALMINDVDRHIHTTLQSLDLLEKTYITFSSPVNLLKPFG